MLNEIIKVILSKRNNIWLGSKYEQINLLKNDESGKAGELLIKQFCKKNNIKTSYYEDIISTDGTYDIIIENKKVEIKTARVSSNGSFQHEGLRLDEYSDFYFFIDILPEYYYLTIIPSKTIKKEIKHSILGIMPHLRRRTENTYKLDFRETTSIKKAIAAGISIKVEDEENNNLKAFIIESLKS